MMTEHVRKRAESIEELLALFGRFRRPDLTKASIEGFETRPTARARAGRPDQLWGHGIEMGERLK